MDIEINPHEMPMPTRRLPAWAISVSMHLCALFLLLYLSAQSQRGAATESSRTGGIVLVSTDRDSTEYLSEGEVDQANEASAAQQNPRPLASEQERPDDLLGRLSQSSPVDSPGTGNDLERSLGDAQGLLNKLANRNAGGKVTTEVFGVTGTGSTFVYVFDRSASMEGFEGRPLKAAKQALLDSINSLGPIHQFQIVFYSHLTRVFNPGPGEPVMVLADDDNKRSAVRFIQATRGDGGTDHVQALKLALSFNPDVIFLLTDAEGGFTAAELGELAHRNRVGTIINTVEFGVGSRDDNSANRDRSLEKLSEQNNGRYVYKNVLTLEHP